MSGGQQEQDFSANEIEHRLLCTMCSILTCHSREEDICALYNFFRTLLLIFFCLAHLSTHRREPPPPINLQGKQIAAQFAYLPIFLL